MPHTAPSLLCTENEIAQLVSSFYAAVRRDPLIGPVFNANVHDWDVHIARLSDFWSSVLLGSRRYSGAPMPRHLALADLSAQHFQRWLELFRDTTAAQPNAALAAQAIAAAQRIAHSLWFGYQIHHHPGQAPADLHDLAA